MMKLTTRSLGLIEDEYAVAWRVGTQRKGIIYVEGLSTKDALVAAELVAIRHLLFARNVFKRDIISGDGIAIEFSSPLIKKVYRGKTTKKHLMPPAHFMQTNLQGVAMEITSPKDEYLPAIGDDVPVEYICANDKPIYDVITTQSLGQIRLTTHAVSQYEERLHSGEAKKPLVSLIGRLRHPDLRRQPLPDREVKHKLRKYGKVDNLEIWGHDTSQMHYVVIRDHGSDIGTLVTVYKRHPDYL